jgi:hypothetical protein
MRRKVWIFDFGITIGLADYHRRILQHLPIRPRICHWQKLPLPSRPQDIQCQRPKANRRPGSRTRSHRNHPELPPRRLAFHEPPADRTVVRQQRQRAILPRLPDRRLFADRRRTGSGVFRESASSRSIRKQIWRFSAERPEAYAGRVWRST